MLEYTASSVSYSNTPLMDNPTISAIMLEKIIIPALLILVSSVLVKDLIAIYKVAPTKNFNNASPPNRKAVTTAITIYGIIFMT